MRKLVFSFLSLLIAFSTFCSAINYGDKIYIEKPDGNRISSNLELTKTEGVTEQWQIFKATSPSFIGEVTAGDQILLKSVTSNQYLCPTVTFNKKRKMSKMGVGSSPSPLDCAWRLKSLFPDVLLEAVRYPLTPDKQGRLVFLRRQPLNLRKLGLVRIKEPKAYSKWIFKPVGSISTATTTTTPGTAQALTTAAEVMRTTTGVVAQKMEEAAKRAKEAAIMAPIAPGAVPMVGEEAPWTLPGGWRRIRGGAAQIAIGVRNGQPLMWAVGRGNHLWRGDFVGGDFRFASTLGQGKWVDVGSDGTVAVVAMDDKLWIWDWNTNRYTKYSATDRSLKMVSVANANDIWVVTDNGQILRLQNNKLEVVKRGGAKSVDAAADGTVVCVETDGSVLRYTGSGQAWESVWIMKSEMVAVGSKTFMRAVRNGAGCWYLPKSDSWKCGKPVADSNKRAVHIDVNELGYIVQLRAQQVTESGVSNGYVIYWVKRTVPEEPEEGEEAAVVKPGTPGAPAVAKAGELEKKIEAAEKMTTPRDKILAFKEVVTWAKGAGAKFAEPIADKQRAFVWTHLEPLHKAVGTMPAEYPDVPALFELLIEAKGNSELIGPYDNYIAFWIDGLAKKGVKLPPIEIKPDDTISDLLEKAAARPSPDSRLASYDKIIQWCVVGGKTLSTNEQTQLVWGKVYTLFNDIAKLPETNDKEKAEKAELQKKLTELLTTIKEKPAIVGPFGGLFETVFKVKPVEVKKEEPKPTTAPAPAPAPAPVVAPTRGGAPIRRGAPTARGRR